MKNHPENKTTKPENTKLSSLLIPLSLACSAFLPQAQAVLPAPDGFYPGGNTAEGQNALFSLTIGTYNTGVGLFSLRSNTEVNFNTATGAGTLLANIGDENTAAGAGALLSNTTGPGNTANGAFALFANTIGISNTANGLEALFSNTEGDQNTARGALALESNTTGSLNTAIGFLALLSNTTGNVNTATGIAALESNTTGSGNTANGVSALTDNTTGSSNTAIGIGALLTNTTGSFNTALGSSAGSLVTTASSVICIGAPGANVDNSCFIGQIFNTTSSGGTAVFVNSDGKLGTATSARRFKDDIKPMKRASEALFALKPVTFHYKKEIDPQGAPQFGLVAEDVEKLNPDLVVRDAEGKVNTVRYEAINAMLLNEFLKEHKKVEKLQATIVELKSTVAQQRKDFETTATQQQKGMELLTAQLKEHASQIKEVSAQLQLSKPAPTIVAADR